MEDEKYARAEMKGFIDKSYRGRRKEVEIEYEGKLKYLDDEKKRFVKLNLDNLVKRAKLVLKEPNKRVPEGDSPLEDVFLRDYGFLEYRATGRMTLDGGGIFGTEFAEEVPEYAYYSTKKGHEFYKKAFGGAK
jgi:hypothetical protein